MTMYVEYINCPKLSGADHVKDDDDTGKCLATLLRNISSDAQHYISGFIHTSLQDRNQSEANQKQDSAMLLSKPS